MKKLISIFLLSLFGMFFSIQVSADRLKDLVSFAGIRSNQLMGYGIVVGLDGTGDSSLALTLQSMQSTISQFGMNVDSGSLSGKNSAAVMITADLDPFTKIGQKITVTVSSMGKAKSLRGGTLLMTPSCRLCWASKSLGPYYYWTSRRKPLILDLRTELLWTCKNAQKE